MPRYETSRQSTVARITPPAPERKPYLLPKPWTLKAIPEGYALFAANGNEAMRFLATANRVDFPDGRTLEEARVHAEKMLGFIMGKPDRDQNAA
jgi:hypothetical protein